MTTRNNGGGFGAAHSRSRHGLGLATAMTQAAYTVPGWGAAPMRIVGSQFNGAQSFGSAPVQFAGPPEIAGPYSGSSGPLGYTVRGAASVRDCRSRHPFNASERAKCQRDNAVAHERQAYAHYQQAKGAANQGKPQVAQRQANRARMQARAADEQARRSGLPMAKRAAQAAHAHAAAAAEAIASARTKRAEIQQSGRTPPPDTESLADQLINQFDNIAAPLTSQFTAPSGVEYDPAVDDAAIESGQFGPARVLPWLVGGVATAALAVVGVRMVRTRRKRSK
jgi:hypothetical protein